MLRISSFIGLAALAAASVQAAPSPNGENWVQLGSEPSFELGDRLASSPPARLAGRLPTRAI